MTLPILSADLTVRYGVFELKYKTQPGYPSAIVRQGTLDHPFSARKQAVGYVGEMPGLGTPRLQDTGIILLIEDDK